MVVTECEDPLRQFHHAKDGVEVISTRTASEWCVDDGGTHAKAHLFGSRRLLVAMTECEDPLRQFHHAKDGVGIICTCSDSE